MVIGVVAQSVRSPPCQGGSCGFEPRQSRKNDFLLNLYLNILNNVMYKQGERGIRTLDSFHYAGFQDRSLQPLDHLSNYIEVLS